MFYKNKKTRVGLIITMSQDNTWPQDFVDIVKSYLPKARKTLQDMGFEVFDCGELARTSDEMKKQGEDLRGKGIHALVVYVGSWTYANNTVTAAINADVPVVVWANSNVETFGIVGGSIARGALDEIGIKNFLVYGDFKDERLINNLKAYLNGIAGATKLKGMIYGEGGSRSMGMITARIDPSEWLARFGVDVDGFDQVDLMKRAQKYKDAEIKEFIEWIKKQFGGIEVSEEVMGAQVRLYFALRELIIEKNYDFLSVKCLPEMPSCYTTFCLAHVLLNDSCDDGFGENSSFVASCEADANGALTMQILNNISGKTTMFTDVLYYDYYDNIIRMCNCGAQPTEFAKSRKDVVWVTEGLREFEWKMGGACPRYIGAPGELTIARLSRIKGKYVMLITTGNAVETPLERINETNSQQPHVFTKLNCNPDEFIKSLRSNHIHVVKGNYKKELEVTCNILEIEPIIPGN